MNPRTAAITIAALSHPLSFFLGGTRQRRQNAERPCLACKTPHRHNNAFCSPACCEAHKSAMKAARKGE